MNAAIVLLESDLQNFDAEIIEIQKQIDGLKMKERGVQERKAYVVDVIDRAKKADEEQAKEVKKAENRENRKAKRNSNQKSKSESVKKSEPKAEVISDTPSPNE